MLYGLKLFLDYAILYIIQTDSTDLIFIIKLLLA